MFWCVGAQTIIGQAGRFGVVELLAKIGHRHAFCHIDVAAAGHHQARGVELGAAGLVCLGGRADLQVNVLDADVFHLEFLEHLDGGGPVEHAQRIGGDAEFDSPGFGLHDGGGRRDANRAKTRHSGGGAQKTAA